MDSETSGTKHCKLVFGHNMDQIRESCELEIHEKPGCIPEALSAKLFSNPVIWKVLGNCLNFPDLKACRLVSKGFSSMVVIVTNFKDRALLKLEGEDIIPENLNNTAKSWKNLAFKFPLDKISDVSNYEWLFKELKDVEFLSLRVLRSSFRYNRVASYDIFGRLLSSCPKLKRLAVLPEFIYRGSVGIFKNNKVLGTLEELEELEILRDYHYNWGEIRGNNEEKFLKESRVVTKEFTDSVKNLKSYKSKFFRFQLPDGKLEDDLVAYSYEVEFMRRLCEDIVANNSQHLESRPFCDLNQPIYSWRLPDVKYRYLDSPKLRSLRVESSQLIVEEWMEDMDFARNWKFIEYLNSLPRLENLKVTYPLFTIRSSAWWPKFYKAVAGHGKSMKKLKLQAEFFHESDWAFLLDSKLEELSLLDLSSMGDRECNDWISRVLKNLPGTIRKIYLSGESPLCPVSPRAKPFKIENLARLDPNLITEFTVDNAFDIVGNEFAQYVMKNFKMLRKLGLDRAKTDDSGLLGISALKGLHFLSLVSCGISDELLNTMEFLELRYLD